MTHSLISSLLSLYSFDLEAKQQDVERLKRRVRELEVAYKNAKSATGSNDVKGLGSKNIWGDDEGFGSGVRGKRERDLEGVVEAMKKVVDKLKSENDRLRKGVGVIPISTGVEARGGGGGGDMPRTAAEKKKTEKLEEDLKSVHGKLKTLEDSGQRLAQKQQQLTSMRKQLKGKEEELAATKETLDALAAEKEALRRKSAASEGRVQQLEVAVQQARQLSKAPQGGIPSRDKDKDKDKDKELKEIAELKKKAAEDRDDNALLRSQLYDLENNLRDLERSGLEDSRARGDMSAPEAKRLKEENEKLRQELSAFDLDFFEEIENLKYAHSEAVKKLRVYEGGRDIDGYLGRQR